MKIRPVLLKGNICFQETVTRGTQVFHDNFDKEEMQNRIMYYMKEEFRRLEARSVEGQLTALVSKKGKVTRNARDRLRCRRYCRICLIIGPNSIF